VNKNVEIIRSKDCDNSPKNKLIQELSIKVLLGLWNEIEVNIDDKSSIRIIKESRIEMSLKDYIKNGGKLYSNQILKISILSAISHGRIGVSNIEINQQNNNHEICIHCEFKSAGSKILKYIKIFGL
jgi:hypothetical protein